MHKTRLDRLDCSTSREKKRIVGMNRHSNRHTPPKGSASCVQNFDDSLDFAIRMTYRISLRSSSLWEPRHPLLKVLISFHRIQVSRRILFGWVSIRRLVHHTWVWSKWILNGPSCAIKHNRGRCDNSGEFSHQKKLKFHVTEDTSRSLRILVN